MKKLKANEELANKEGRKAGKTDFDRINRIYRRNLKLEAGSREFEAKLVPEAQLEISQTQRVWICPPKNPS